eukprot:1869168-Rhodomonas_salina.3
MASSMQSHLIARHSAVQMKQIMIVYGKPAQMLTLRSPRSAWHHPTQGQDWAAQNTGPSLEGGETRLVLAADEEGAGAGSLGEGPVDALDDGRVEHAAGRERVVHVGAGVGRGDEVEHDAHEDQDLEELAHVLAVRLDQIEDRVVESAARLRRHQPRSELSGMLRASVVGGGDTRARYPIFSRAMAPGETALKLAS